MPVVEAEAAEIETGALLGGAEIWERAFAIANAAVGSGLRV